MSRISIEDINFYEGPSIIQRVSEPKGDVRTEDPPHTYDAHKDKTINWCGISSGKTRLSKSDLDLKSKTFFVNPGWTKNADCCRVVVKEGATTQGGHSEHEDLPEWLSSCIDRTFHWAAADLGQGRRSTRLLAETADLMTADLALRRSDPKKSDGYVINKDDLFELLQFCYDWELKYTKLAKLALDPSLVPPVSRACLRTSPPVPTDDLSDDDEVSSDGKAKAYILQTVELDDHDDATVDSVLIKPWAVEDLKQLADSARKLFDKDGLPTQALRDAQASAVSRWKDLESGFGGKRPSEFEQVSWSWYGSREPKQRLAYQTATHLWDLISHSAAPGDEDGRARTIVPEVRVVPKAVWDTTLSTGFFQPDGPGAEWAVVQGDRATSILSPEPPAEETSTVGDTATSILSPESRAEEKSAVGSPFVMVADKEWEDVSEGLEAIALS